MNNAFLMCSLFSMLQQKLGALCALICLTVSKYGNKARRKKVLAAPAETHTNEPFPGIFSTCCLHAIAQLL